MRRDSIVFEEPHVDLYAITEFWSYLMQTLNSSGWLDFMGRNTLLQSFVMHNALPYLGDTVYPKPEFAIPAVSCKGGKLEVTEKEFLNDTFCQLRLFSCSRNSRGNILLVAPLSGHWSTMLRDTITAFVGEYDVYLVDWKNVRDIPITLSSCVNISICWQRKGYFMSWQFASQLYRWQRHLHFSQNVMGHCRKVQ